MDNLKIFEFWNTKNTFILLSGLVENELILKLLGHKLSQRYPRDFAGETAIVYCKVGYVSPFDKFVEIKKIISAVNSKTGLRKEFKGIVALDLKEWLDHYEDEYLTILLKFLHDKLEDGWKYVFTFGSANEYEIKPLLRLIARYLNPLVMSYYPLRDKDLINTMIKGAGRGKNIHIEEKAINRLMDGLNMEFEKTLDVESIRNILIDMIGRSNKETITIKDVESYMDDKYSLLNLLCEDRFAHRGGIKE